jgi:hypothetical protein
MTRPAGNHSISPASGYYGTNWPMNSGVIPQSFSMGGWTSGNLGFIQQTFLGASIRSFNLNGGFGDSSSQLSVELINDEFNKSDSSPQGIGDDVYHNGLYDTFSPPPVGSPVFFKFGTNHASVEEAYKKVFDDIYNTNTFIDIPPVIVGNYDKNNFIALGDGQYVNVENNTIIDNSEFLSSLYRGKYHLTFGGILQSYVQNRGPAGNPAYSVQVVDPREILANTTLILNNYAGTTFKHANMFNIYGFLEYNPTEVLEANLKTNYQFKDVLRKNIATDGRYSYSGYDMYSSFTNTNSNFNFTIAGVEYKSTSEFPPRLPITGTGFARRGDQGIPYYRLRQGLNSLLGIDGKIPQEYIDAGFGGYINFRGYNYIVDLGGLKEIEDYYFFDFDQINLLDLCLEICDITSSDLFVTLLPIIDHPSCARFYSSNNTAMKDNKPKEIIAGIIRVDAIDRSKQPEYGAIKKYIDSLATSGIFVENQDVGFELSNVTTDKFIVGAQEVDMYYFSANADRDDLEIRKQKAGKENKASSLLGDQWKFETSLSQQIIPYYGLLGNHGYRAATVPRGFGAYQQILLDSTSLNANGVGNYYVATEMELRASLISYERWSEFLQIYNDVYMESTEQDDVLESSALQKTPALPQNAPNGVILKPSISQNYGVSVPRSVFDTYTDGTKFGDDDLPSSPCNPPYGYPLYYKRATKIGIASAGLANIQNTYNTILTNLTALQNSSDDDFANLVETQWTAIKDGTGPNGIQSEEEKAYYDWLEGIIKNNANTKKADVIGLIDNTLTGLGRSFKILNRLSKKTGENSRRVYNFVKQVAEECLGKKFLVRIPNETNLFYSSGIQLKDPEDDGSINEYHKGPFGFRPRAINYDPYYENGTEFKQKLQNEIDRKPIYNSIRSFLTREDNIAYSKFKGALHSNWNPISEEYEFNYEPSKQGGYIDFDLYENINSKKSLGISQGLIPQDIKNFINENNRISAYVRFDNSQYLSLDGLSPDSFTQQKVDGGNFIPDILNELDNTKTDKFISFPDPNKDTPQKTIAFVKCELDDHFYLIPKTEKKSLSVYGQSVKDVGKYSKPNKIYDCATNSYQNSFSYYEAHYVPEITEGQKVDVLEYKSVYSDVLKSDIIDTEQKNLDIKYVYALITLPSRISPTMDARFKDSTFQQPNAIVLKHILCLDVVKGLKGFETPTFFGNPPNIINDPNFKFDPMTIDAGIAAHKVATSNLNFAFPQRINAAVPSPVYPDLVVLPLMSKERCYGPWVSSQSDVQAKVYQNVAGKVDFIKDENLAPWNYSGYQLMNAAGILQAEFANSLLLQTERGGFVIPSAPFGITLGKELLNGGPLITNLAVDVSENGVRTTCKMDLYTAKFGKLQKQKQDQISKISRERQKLKDERNSLIRKGLGKNATMTNYQSIYNNLGGISNMIKNDGLDDIFNPNDPNNIMVATVIPRNNVGNTGKFAGTYGSSNEVQSTSYDTQVSFQSNSSLSNTASHFADNLQLARSSYNSASSAMSDTYYATAKEPFHKNMPCVYDNNLAARQDIYADIDNLDNDQLTIWEA